MQDQPPTSGFLMFSHQPDKLFQHLWILWILWVAERGTPQIPFFLRRKPGSENASFLGNHPQFMAELLRLVKSYYEI